MSVSLHVSNVGNQPNEKFIRSMFEKYGEVQEVKLIIDKESDAYKDYCFVLMKEQSSAWEALRACNGVILDNRALQVSFAKSKQEDKKAVDCFLCGGTGHYQRECRVPGIRESLGQPPMPPPRGGMPRGGPPRGGPPRGGPPRGGPTRGGFAAERGAFAGGYSQGGYGASAAGLVEPGLDEYGGYTDEFGGYLDAAGNYFDASQLDDNSAFGFGTYGEVARGSLRGRGGAMRGRGRGGETYVTPPVESRPGDWTCEKCGNVNFSHRIDCNRCVPNQPQNIEAKPGDWICPREKCGNLNFARRTQCKKCSVNRPLGLGV